MMVMVGSINGSISGSMSGSMIGSMNGSMNGSMMMLIFVVGVVSAIFFVSVAFRLLA